MRKIRDADTLEGLLGFLWNDPETPGATPHIFVSDSWTILKDRVLELGAHRENGVEGTGRDLKEVIQKIDSWQLAETIVDLGGAEDLRSHTALGYDDAIELGERMAIEVVYALRNESVSLDGFVDQALDLARDRGYSYDYGYSDDFMDGLHRGVMNVVETSEKRIRALDLALVMKALEAGVDPDNRYLAGWLSKALTAYYEQPFRETVFRAEPAVGTHPSPSVTEWIGGTPDDVIGKEPAPAREATLQERAEKLFSLEPGSLDESFEPSRVQLLLESVHKLTADLAGDYPATGSEAATAARRIAERGDVGRLEELRDILAEEQRTGSIENLDLFLVDEFTYESEA